jgi:putative Holliday junction resolvase
MGVDLGSRRIGVALTSGAMAFPHTVLARTGDPGADRAALAAIVRDEGVGRVVVGLPLSLSGTAGAAAVAAAAEAEALALALDVPVETWDERMTTVVADRAMAAAGGRGPRARRRTVDQVAATVILQSWVDANRATGASGASGASGSAEEAIEAAEVERAAQASPAERAAQAVEATEGGR